MVEAKKLISNWRYHNPGPMGRLQIAKILILPKFTHIPSVIPNYKGTEAKELDAILKEFIWSSKTNKIAGKRMELPINKGGLG